MELDSIAFFRCLSPGPHVGDGDGGSGVDGLYMSHLTTLPRVSDLKWHSDCHVSDITREVRCLVDWTHLPWGLGTTGKIFFINLGNTLYRENTFAFHLDKDVPKMLSDNHSQV